MKAPAAQETRMKNNTSLSIDFLFSWILSLSRFDNFFILLYTKNKEELVIFICEEIYPLNN